MISLNGQRVLITGGSRGIGRATALLFARAGADVGITYHNRVADAEGVARDIRAMGRKAFIAGGDLADPAVVSRAFREWKAFAAGDGNALDCFVANAGVWPVEELPLTRLSEARWRSTMAPSREALLAVAFPESSPYYYFQAACDGSGHHVFAVTYEEHVANNCQ